MAREKVKPTGRSGPAARALYAFISENNIGRKEAADAIGVRHPSLIAWIKGESKPEALHRKRIEVWTGGKVRENDWMSARDWADLEGTEKFKPAKDPAA